MGSGGHGSAGHVSYDPKGNRYVLVMVDCFSRWTEACPLPNKTALAVADAFCQHIVCCFGMPSVIHSDQGREFENNLMQELCLLCGAHKTRTTAYHPASDGLLERFNRTLPMMLAMFAGENRDDWDDLLPAVMMAYRSSVHKSTGFSRYHLMFEEECTLSMDVGLPRPDQDLPDPIKNPYASWVRTHWKWLMTRSVATLVRLYCDRRGSMISGLSDACLRWEIGLPAKKCKLDSVWVGPYLVVSLVGWAVSIQLQPDSPVIMVHSQNLKKIPRPSGLVSLIDANRPVGLPTPPVLGTSIMGPFAQGSLSIHLTTIAHAFNYRVAVLRDGVKSAALVGRSRRAAERILEDVGIPLGHQVAAMFQIVCTIALEVPLVLQDIESLHGVSPNVSLACEPWGHTYHAGRDVCVSLRTAQVPMFTTYHWIPRRFRLWRKCRTCLLIPVGMVHGWACYLAGAGRPGSVPCVSHRPGDYGHLLLAVYVRWQMGLLVSSDTLSG